MHNTRQQTSQCKSYSNTCPGGSDRKGQYIKHSMLQPIHAEAIAPQMQQRTRDVTPLKHTVDTAPDRPLEFRLMAPLSFPAGTTSEQSISFNSQAAKHSAQHLVLHKHPYA